jgi:hypothetical protein
LGKHGRVESVSQEGLPVRSPVISDLACLHPSGYQQAMQSGLHPNLKRNRKKNIKEHPNVSTHKHARELMRFDPNSGKHTPGLACDTHLMRYFEYMEEFRCQ